MSARGLPAVLLSVLAIAVLVVVAATAVAGWPAVSFGLAALLVAGALVVAVRAARRRRASPPDGLVPVAELSTRALGLEWVRTASALGEPLAPGTRQQMARRRQDTLDELERRDPEGFSRWLADADAAGRNPAEFVHGPG